MLLLLHILSSSAFSINIWDSLCLSRYSSPFFFILPTVLKPYESKPQIWRQTRLNSYWHNVVEVQKDLIIDKKDIRFFYFRRIKNVGTTHLDVFFQKSCLFWFSLQIK
jgi:hypothetical protein